MTNRHLLRAAALVVAVAWGAVAAPPGRTEAMRPPAPTANPPLANDGPPPAGDCVAATADFFGLARDPACVSSVEGPIATDTRLADLDVVAESPRRTVAPGGTLTLRVTFRNQSDTPLPLVFDGQRFELSTFGERGERVDASGIHGAAAEEESAPRRLRVVLLPRGALTKELSWTADGIEEPLRPGRYLVRIKTPLRNAPAKSHLAMPSLAVTVAR